MRAEAKLRFSVVSTERKYMQPEDRDSIEWKARIFKDKALIPQIEEE